MLTTPNSADANETCAPLVAGAPVVCADCAAPLCLRKQVLNLAVGNIDSMLCLSCLAAQSDQQPEELLAGMKLYILGRECLRKEWRRYESENACPAPQSCYPSICFAQPE